MNQLFRVIEKAQRSKFYLFLLNVSLHRAIPFNKPHGLKIVKVMNTGFKILLPYKKRNLNHINSIHACALATLAEYISGLTLMKNLASGDYRIIMKSISMTYHYQAKADVVVELSLGEEWMDQHILSPLKHSGSIFIEVPVEVFDIQQNHICTGLIRWQIKKWDEVRTKVN